MEEMKVMQYLDELYPSKLPVQSLNPSLSAAQSRYRVLAVFMAILAAVAMLFTSTTAFANQADPENAQKELRNYAYKELAANKYSVDGGGYINGVDMFTDGDNGQKQVNYDNYNKLNKNGQQKFIDDLQASMNRAANSDEKTKQTNQTTNVTDETSQNWLKEMQSQPGVGSRILQQTLGQTTPDFVSANAIYKPFAGVIGILIALISIVMMALLALTLAIDLAYIVLPMARGLAKEGSGGDGKGVSLVSKEAINAVKKAEEGEGNMPAVGYYLKSRFIGLLVLGFCLVLLISGSIFTFVGSMVDLTFGLVNVFLGSS